MGKNSIAIILIVILVLAGSVGGWYWFKFKPEQEAKEKARLEQIAQEEAAQKAKEAAAQKQSKYGQLIKDADAARDQEKWQTAYSLYTDASALFPNQQYPKDQLDLVTAKIDEQAALQAKIEAGIVDRIEAPTGRYYVIVSSSVDEDLAEDYAKVLQKEGRDVKIIEPNNTTNRLFHRVSLASYATLEEAEAAADSFSNYGEGIWVLAN